MKILLIQPGVGKRMVGFTDLVRPEPLALEIIAAAVPEHEVKILDLRVDSSLDDTLSSFQPELVGITGYTTDVPQMLSTLRHVKEAQPGVTTVVGGYHASLCPEDFDVESADIIVVGEGEVTFRELVSGLEEKRDLASIAGIIYRRDGRQVATPLRPLVRSLDELPFPSRHLTDRYRQHYHFHFWDDPYLAETSRGCPYRCIFCAVWKFHRGQCRFRSPERVLADLRALAGKVVCFVDDNFFQNLRRSEKLYDLLKNAGIRTRFWIQARADSIAKRPDLVEKWSQIGLSAALIGFEKFREDELDAVNKKSSIKTNEAAMKILNDHGVDMWGTFIVDPQWTRADFDALIDYIRQKKIYFPTMTILTPLPGTAFFREKFHELITRDYELFDFLHTVLPTKLPLEEFYENMARLYARTSLSLGELKRRIRSGEIPASALERFRVILKDVTNPAAYLGTAGTNLASVPLSRAASHPREQA